MQLPHTVISNSEKLTHPNVQLLFSNIWTRNHTIIHMYIVCICCNYDMQAGFLCRDHVFLRQCNTVSLALYTAVKKYPCFFSNILFLICLATINYCWNLWVIEFFSLNKTTLLMRNRRVIVKIWEKADSVSPLLQLLYIFVSLNKWNFSIFHL